MLWSREIYPSPSWYRTQSVQLVARRYIDWAIDALASGITIFSTNRMQQNPSWTVVAQLVKNFLVFGFFVMFANGCHWALSWAIQFPDRSALVHEVFIITVCHRPHHRRSLQNHFNASSWVSIAMSDQLKQIAVSVCVFYETLVIVIRHLLLHGIL